MRSVPVFFILILSLSFKCGQKNNGVVPEKIIFHTTGCYGFCPTYHLQVDKNRNVLLHAAVVYKHDSITGYSKDTSAAGYYTGIISDSTYNRLVNAVQELGIDTLNFNSEIMCCDAPVRTIIVYYNGKRRHMASMAPPESARGLISMLLSICKNSSLHRTSEEFDIEK